MEDKNPHIRRMKSIARKSGLEYSRFDVSIAREKGFKTCGKCGRKAYYKPTVGSYVCLCGSLLRLGEWTDSLYEKHAREWVKSHPDGILYAIDKIREFLKSGTYSTLSAPIADLFERAIVPSSRPKTAARLVLAILEGVSS